MPRITKVLSVFAVLFVPAFLAAQTTPPTHAEAMELAADCGGAAVAGERVFAESCDDCHALRPEDVQASGPHLGDLFTRGIAADPDYGYSPELSAFIGGADLWEREYLFTFLAEPAAWSPDHPVFEDEQTRRDVMTFLRTATLAPPPPPGELPIPEEAFAIVGDPAYGEYLSTECASCHQSAAARGVPVIEGLGRRAFITALWEYRAGSRENSTMVTIAVRLTDEEIAHLAAHFAPEG